MFFRKRDSQKSDPQLSALVGRNHRTGYVFVDINNDLGDAASAIMGASPIARMSYGYARRAAAMAMYAQGLIDKSVLDHVQGIFKALQIQTEHTVEFQEAAFDDALEFMRTYHDQINKLTITGVRKIAEEYERPDSGPIQDQQLIGSAIELMYQEQERSRPAN